MCSCGLETIFVSDVRGGVGYSIRPHERVGSLQVMKIEDLFKGYLKEDGAKQKGQGCVHMLTDNSHLNQSNN